MFDTEKFEYTEYWKDKQRYEKLYVKVQKNWSKGIIYKNQVDKLNRLKNKLVYHAYPTYTVLQPIGAY
jgi:hypothetical protein